MKKAGFIAANRAVVLLLLLTAAAYLAVAGAGFVWDDYWLFVENEHFMKAGLVDLLSGQLWQGTGLEGGLTYYRPVLQASFFCDRELFGFSPAGWHLHSLLWHLLSVLLAYLLFSRLTRAGNEVDPRNHSTHPTHVALSNLPVLAGAACFALHPLQSEAVVWIAARNDLLATAFILALLLLLLQEEHAPNSGGRIALAGLCYLAAMLSKESAMLAPLFALLLDWARGIRFSRKHLTRYLALLLVLLLVLVLRKAFGQETVWLELAHWQTLLLRSPTILGTYGLLLVKPWPLLVSRHLDLMPPSALSLLSSTLLLLPLALTLLLRKRIHFRLAVAALIAAASSLLPAIVAIATYKLIGERYFYLPMLWLSLWLVCVLPSKRAVLFVLVPCVVAALMLLHVRLPDWQSDLSLFGADVRRAPNCLNFTNYGSALNKQRRYAEVLALLRSTQAQNAVCPRFGPVALQAAKASGQLEQTRKRLQEIQQERKRERGISQDREP